MATAQELIDAMNRLTASVVVLQEKQQTDSKTKWTFEKRGNASARNFGKALGQFFKGQWRSSFKNLRTGLKRTAKNTLIGRRSKSFFGALRATGPIGGGLAAVGTLAVGFLALEKIVNGVTNRLIEMNRQYAEVSASMAVVMAERDIRETFRDIEKGNRLADSARSLSRSEQDRKDSTKEIEIATERLQNTVMGWVNEAMRTVMVPLNEMAKGINGLLDLGKGGEDEGEPATAGEWLEAVEKQAAGPLLFRQKVLEQVQQQAAGFRK